MPLQEQTVMAQRLEIVLAMEAGVNVRALCAQRELGPDTVYRWRRRYRAAGGAGLVDRARRPHTSPGQTAAAMEALVRDQRAQHPAWRPQDPAAARGSGLCGGPRRLHDHRHPAPGGPAGAAAGLPRAFGSFEHADPNALWQMDCKGWVPAGAGRCHPLTVLDDHSRFCLVLQACADERTETVRAALITAFRAYGLPARIAVDHGAPWGNRPAQPWTPLGVWLLRIGVAVSHSRPSHTQTLGKEERFHRTLKAEVLTTPLPDLATAQDRFDAWRPVSNTERPHEALGGAVPAARHQLSARPYPETLPPLPYPATDDIRRVQAHGLASFCGRRVRLPRAFRGQPVAFRPTAPDGCFTVHFATACLGHIDLRAAAADPIPYVRSVPEQGSDMSPV